VESFCEFGIEPSGSINAGKLSSGLTTRDLSSSAQLHRVRVREYIVEVVWDDVDWIGLAQDRNTSRALVNSVLNLQVSYNAGKLLSVQPTRNLSSSA
jgi:hypothetical protein